VSRAHETPFPVVAVCGLAVEARIASGPGVRALAGGGKGELLRAALEREVASGARAIMSFGIAGGLVGDLTPGTCLIARNIITREAHWGCDLGWARILHKRLPWARIVDVAGVDAPVADPASKRALHDATGTAAVDTESHIAAAVAAAQGLPFAAFRVVADGVERRLPLAANVALRHDGAISVAAVLGSVARKPGQLPLLVRTGIDAQRALRALLRGRRRLGARLGYPDLGELLADVP